MTDKIALIADTHANAPALSAVLAHIDAQGIKRIWFLGDAIGRGPRQGVSVTLRMLYRRYEELDDRDKEAWLKGNHDLLCLGLAQHGYMSPDGKILNAADNELAISVAETHKRILNLTTRELRKLREWLCGLKNGYAVMSDEGIYLMHGAYRYIDETQIDDNAVYHHNMDVPPAVRRTLRNIRQYEGHTPTRAILSAHTHLAHCMQADEQDEFVPVTLRDGETYTFNNLSHHPIAINPGSVGFPREDKRKPSYMVLAFGQEDNLDVTYHNVCYDNSRLLQSLTNDYPASYRKQIESHCHSVGTN